MKMSVFLRIFNTFFDSKKGFFGTDNGERTEAPFPVTLEMSSMFQVPGSRFQSRRSRFRFSGTCNQELATNN